MSAGRKQSARSRHENGIKLAAILVLCLLLILPVCALTRLSSLVDWFLLVGAAAVVSGWTYFVYRSDKRRAEAGARRIPETILHLSELIGGWPGAFLAQRKFRHKISKLSYQVGFWAILTIHQVAALDFLIGWRLINGVLRFVSGAQDS
jgi:uncharacterized membrane protein YsdA (DUF1294 family)